MPSRIKRVDNFRTMLSRDHATGRDRMKRYAYYPGVLGGDGVGELPPLGGRDGRQARRRVRGDRGLELLRGHALLEHRRAAGARRCARATSPSPSASGLDVVAPCSACFKNLYHANEHLKTDADLAEHVNFALEADDLHYARHDRGAPPDPRVRAGRGARRDQEEGDAPAQGAQGGAVLRLPAGAARPRTTACDVGRARGTSRTCCGPSARRRSSTRTGCAAAAAR